jgi:hypothetical protein
MVEMSRPLSRFILAESLFQSLPLLLLLFFSPREALDDS